jgi:hypothetical protein
MTIKSKKPDDTPEISLESFDLRQTSLAFRLVGTTPLIMHRMAQKAVHELLYPAPKKNKAERQTTLKHDPIEEYRASVYRTTRETDAPTLLHMPSGSFKKAIAQAAIDLPGPAKAAVGRMTSVAGTIVHIYGVPKVYTCMVRNSGMQKTPDVRTRAIIPAWCCDVTVECIGSIITPPMVEKLLHAAGVIVGIGDGRPEKGAMSFGRWRLCERADDPEYIAIAKSGGRQAQAEALDNPQYYDDETEEIIDWFLAERERRTKGRNEVVAAVTMDAAARRNGKGKVVING